RPATARCSPAITTRARSCSSARSRPARRRPWSATTWRAPTRSWAGPTMPSARWRRRSRPAGPTRRRCARARIRRRCAASRASKRCWRGLPRARSARSERPLLRQERIRLLLHERVHEAERLLLHGEYRLLAELLAEATQALLREDRAHAVDVARNVRCRDGIDRRGREPVRLLLLRIQLLPELRLLPRQQLLRPRLRAETDAGAESLQGPIRIGLLLKHGDLGRDAADGFHRHVDRVAETLKLLHIHLFECHFRSLCWTSMRLVRPTSLSMPSRLRARPSRA